MSKAINITEAVPSRQIRNQKKEKTMTNNVDNMKWLGFGATNLSHVTKLTK